MSKDSRTLLRATALPGLCELYGCMSFSKTCHSCGFVLHSPAESQSSVLSLRARLESHSLARQPREFQPKETSMPTRRYRQVSLKKRLNIGYTLTLDALLLKSVIQCRTFFLKRRDNLLYHDSIKSRRISQSRRIQL